MLTRPGNKQRIAGKILPYFPPHELYIEPFFGAGGMFFNKPLAKYNVCNDLDSDVFNLFKVLQSEKMRNKLYKYFELTPIHSDLLTYWKKNKETNPIKKAARFLFLSNNTLLGNGDTLRFGNQVNQKKLILKNLKYVNKKLEHVQFTNFDFRKFINAITFRRKGKTTSFVYADPPYLGTDCSNYETAFKKQDSEDLFNILIESEIRFAVSEFDNPFILELAEKHKLNVIPIAERQNLKNRRNEILITNYEVNKLF